MKGSDSLKARILRNSLLCIQLVMTFQFLISGYKKSIILLKLKRSKLLQPSDAILIARVYSTQIGRQVSCSLKLDQQIGLCCRGFSYDYWRFFLSLWGQFH